MKTPEEILLEFYGNPAGKLPVTEEQKRFYRLSVEDCLRLMKIYAEQKIDLEKIVDDNKEYILGFYTGFELKQYLDKHYNLLTYDLHHI